ncbi:UNVERIFIED_ORG: hypothetical protein ABIB52_000513 [Arthrobacter sp. UYCu721]
MASQTPAACESILQAPSQISPPDTVKVPSIRFWLILGQVQHKERCLGDFRAGCPGGLRASERERPSIGQRLPAHVTGLGKALLAYVSPAAVRDLYPNAGDLPAMAERSIRTLAVLQEEFERVRARGVAFEREESTLNVFCAAAPVRDGSGAVVAAITTSVSSAHWHQRPEECWADLVQQGAARLYAQLGFTDPR